MKTHAIRLRPGQDIKNTLENFVKIKNIQAGFIVTCVGSLRRATLRMADENITEAYNRKFEITSLVGTLSPDGVHLHIALADETGKIIGGHLKEGSEVYSTAEIIIGESETHTFTRLHDTETGFKELEIKEK